MYGVSGRGRLWEFLINSAKDLFCMDILLPKEHSKICFLFSNSLQGDEASVVYFCSATTSIVVPFRYDTPILFRYFISAQFLLGRVYQSFMTRSPRLFFATCCKFKPFLMYISKIYLLWI